jgi:hypothetical protein
LSFFLSVFLFSFSFFCFLFFYFSFSFSHSKIVRIWKSFKFGKYLNLNKWSNLKKKNHIRKMFKFKICSYFAKKVKISNFKKCSITKLF